MPKKTGVNEKCPCGSGKKYKKCCSQKEKEMKNKVQNANDLKILFTEIYKILEASENEPESEKQKVLTTCKDRVFSTSLDNRLVHDMNYNNFKLYTKIMAIDELRSDAVNRNGALRNEDRFEQIVNRFDIGSDITTVRQELDREEQMAAELGKLSSGK